jgi:hypothetical protein
VQRRPPNNARKQKTDPRYTNGHHPYDDSYDREGQPQRREVKNAKGEGKRRTVRVKSPESKKRAHRKSVAYRHAHDY